VQCAIYGISHNMRRRVQAPAKKKNILDHAGSSEQQWKLDVNYKGLMLQGIQHPDLTAKEDA
jgi:hypothetical protein